MIICVMLEKRELVLWEGEGIDLYRRFEAVVDRWFAIPCADRHYVIEQLRVRCHWVDRCFIVVRWPVIARQPLGLPLPCAKLPDALSYPMGHEVGSCSLRAV
jgi:hypothetical protein